MLRGHGQSGGGEERRVCVCVCVCVCRMVIREEWEAGKQREDGAFVARVQVKREKDVL